MLSSLIDWRIDSTVQSRIQHAFIMVLVTTVFTATSRTFFDLEPEPLSCKVVLYCKSYEAGKLEKCGEPRTNWQSASIHGPNHT
ncbi:hypothetical protein WJX77_003734 [Trebouxia sp. C0004]